MSPSAKFLNPSEAARQLGVSTKALRRYEKRGIISPIRTASGWRVYGPSEMAQATKIVNLRTLGLSLGKVAEILRGDARCLGPTLAAYQAALEGQVSNSRAWSKKFVACETSLPMARRQRLRAWRA